VNVTERKSELAGQRETSQPRTRTAVRSEPPEGGHVASPDIEAHRHDELLSCPGAVKARRGSHFRMKDEPRRCSIQRGSMRRNAERCSFIVLAPRAGFPRNGFRPLRFRAAVTGRTGDRRALRVDRRKRML
jgi:hypothetical protein